MPVLDDAVEGRVLGALIEKEITTPEYYPLSLNALVNACNQKNSRDPVMELSERDVRSALSALENRNLVRVLADSRVPKFEHRVRDQWNLRRDEIALVCLLLLRGPQTAGELRTRADRMYSFDDTVAVSETLERLASRPEPITRLLGRQPGAREARWRHLLDGAEDPVTATNTSGTAPASRGERDPADPRTPSVAERLAALEARVNLLEEAFQRLESRS